MSKIKNRFAKKMLISITSIGVLASPIIFSAGCSQNSNIVHYKDFSIESVKQACDVLGKISEIAKEQGVETIPYSEPTDFNEIYDYNDGGKTWINECSPKYINQITKYTLAYEIIGYMATYYIKLTNDLEGHGLTELTMSFSNFGFDVDNRKVNLEIKIKKVYGPSGGVQRNDFTSILIQQADVWYDVMPIDEWESVSFPCLKLQATINHNNKIIQMGYNFGYLYSNYEVTVNDIKPDSI